MTSPRFSRAACIVAIVAAGLAVATPAGATTQARTFTTAGAASFVVPSGLDRIRVEAVGAAGGQGCGFAAGLGGRGAQVAGTVAVTAGAELKVFVGGGGARPQCAIGTGTGGAGGGGTGTSTLLPGGGGGGASSVATGSAFPAGTPLVVAGGGGGAGGANFSGAGGDAGADGSPGCETSGGGAGKADGGGAGGSQLSPGGSGSYGQGGSGGATSGSAGGGGGGGGLYGGGGGGGHTATTGQVCGGGGGGGSSFLAAGAEDATGPTATPATPAVRFSWTNRPPGDPGAPRLSSGSTPRADGSLSVAWDPSPADLDGDAITYTLERRDGDDTTWTTVASGLTATSYAFGAGGNPAVGEGTWDLRVTASDGLETAGPRASENLVVVDATPPAAPVLQPATTGQSASADVGGVTWYRDSEVVDIVPQDDPPLADGTPGSGVDPSSFTSPFTVTTNGSSQHTRTVADRAGHTSSTSESFTARVDAADPSAAITDCPAQPVAQGAALTLNWAASDGESGLASPATGTVGVDTASLGAVQVKAPTATDNVGHTAAGGVCDVTVMNKPSLTSRPRLSAAAWKRDEVVTADEGGWDGDPTNHDYAWLRCSFTTVASCQPITSADATDDDTTYTLTADDDGKWIRVQVTAENPAGGSDAVSAVSPRIGVPVMQSRPSVSGNTRTGDVLTADFGDWDPPATSYRVRWLRCTTIYLRHCEPITGSPDADDADATYTLVNDDDATRIRARVVARNAAGSSLAETSAPTDLIDKPTLIERSRWLSGGLRTGDTLETDLGEWTGNPTRYDVEWLRCTRTDLSACTRIGSTDATDADARYTLVDDDDARHLIARVTARNASGRGPASLSHWTEKVDKPIVKTRPALTGTVAVGETLTTDHGHWSGDPTHFTVEWLRCTGLSLADCAPIATQDATDGDTTYDPSPDDVGARIRSRVQARNASGDGRPSTSLATTRVTGPASRR